MRVRQRSDAIVRAEQRDRRHAYFWLRRSELFIGNVEDWRSDRLGSHGLLLQCDTEASLLRRKIAGPQVTNA